MRISMMLILAVSVTFAFRTYADSYSLELRFDISAPTKASKEEGRFCSHAAIFLPVEGQSQADAIKKAERLIGTQYTGSMHALDIDYKDCPNYKGPPTIVGADVNLGAPACNPNCHTICKVGDSESTGVNPCPSDQMLVTDPSGVGGQQ